MKHMSAHDKFKVRPMTEADLDQVLIIEAASFPLPWTREHFIGELENRHSFPYVASANDSIFGYVCLMSLFEESQILNIAVDVRQRDRGVARILMNHVISIAREKDADILKLEVRESNNAAITLYEKCGFIRSGLRKNYYEGKEDAVLMEKNLR